MRRSLLCWLFAFLAGVLFAADKPRLKLRVSTETVPPGAVAQFKVFVPDSAAIAGGKIVVDFDPELFGDIIAVSAFSATGDAYGAAVVDGRHLDGWFQSPSGTMGLLPDLPVLTVSIPVQPGAALGTRAAYPGRARTVQSTRWKLSRRS